MGRHSCAHPRWHRALILFGTLSWFHGVGYGALLAVGHSHPSGDAWFAGLAAWIVSTWLCTHLLRWRCQGHERQGGHAAALLLLLGSIAYLTRNR